MWILIKRGWHIFSIEQSVYTPQSIILLFSFEIMCLNLNNLGFILMFWWYTLQLYWMNRTSLFRSSSASEPFLGVPAPSPKLILWRPLEMQSTDSRLYESRPFWRPPGMAPLWFVRRAPGITGPQAQQHCQSPEVIFFWSSVIYFCVPNFGFQKVGHLIKYIY